MTLTTVPTSRPNDQTAIHHLQEAQLSTKETHSMLMHGFRLRILNSGDTNVPKDHFYFYCSLLFLHYLSGARVVLSFQNQLGLNFCWQRLWFPSRTLEYWPSKTIFKGYWVEMCHHISPRALLRIIQCLHYYECHHEHICRFSYNGTLSTASWLTSNKGVWSCQVSYFVPNKSY